MALKDLVKRLQKKEFWVNKKYNEFIKIDDTFKLKDEEIEAKDKEVKRRDKKLKIKEESLVYKDQLLETKDTNIKSLEKIILEERKYREDFER